MRLNLSQTLVARKTISGGLPPPPAGFAYLTDENGVFITTETEDEFIIVPI